MRKATLFFFISLIFLFYFYFNNSLYAQEPKPSLTENQKNGSSKFINYNLVYPGILPDHPLYKIKVLRDKISNMLISDPNKKINFYLLQSDKGMLASAMLIDKNQIELAEETALKAEHNFTQLSRTIGSYYRKNQANQSKAETRDLVVKLKTASSKHQEVLASILKRVPKNNQKTFENVIYFSKINMKSIEETIKEYESP